MARCWALSQKQVRCEAEAGHEGNHLSKVTWDDDHCYDPTQEHADAVSHAIAVELQQRAQPAATPATSPAQILNDEAVASAATQEQMRGRVPIVADTTPVTPVTWSKRCATCEHHVDKHGGGGCTAYDPNLEGPCGCFVFVGD